MVKVREKLRKLPSITQITCLLMFLPLNFLSFSLCVCVFMCVLYVCDTYTYHYVTVHAHTHNT